MSGVGIMAWDQGSAFYRGNWKKGFKHGAGEYIQKDGKRYEGDWVLGKMQG